MSRKRPKSRCCKECRKPLALGEAGPLCTLCDDYLAEEAAYRDYLQECFLDGMEIEHENQDEESRADRS